MTITNKETGEIMDIVVRAGNGLALNPAAIETIRAYETEMKRINAEYKEYKASLLNAMENYGVDNIDTDYFVVSYVEPHTQTRVDSDKLRTRYPEVYEECSKTSMVKSSVRVKLR